jgi:hypothetical protein
MSAHDRAQAKASSTAVPAAAHSSRSASGLLQRKCDCGGSAGISGHCSECDQKQLTLQRQSAGATEPSAAPPVVDEVLRSPGQALDGETRAFMEPRFGHDFNRVRVHTDARAAESARAVNSSAYTVGKDIVFGAGQYEPNTQAGKRLLAHELTHVVQQGDAEGATTPRLASASLTLSQPSDRAEQEASRSAEAIMRGTSLMPAAAGAAGAGASIQRQPAPTAAPATPTKTPTKTPEKLEEKPATTGAEATASHKEGEGELSPIRLKLFELFDKFEKSVIGDEVFDKVETKEAWESQKAEEAVATLIYATEKQEYDKAMKAWEAGGKKGEKPKMPVPVAKFTTCIAMQNVLLKRAFKETGLSIKKAGKQPTYAFATQGAQTAEAIGGGAWHWGKMGMTERPKKGDIIVLAFRGGKVDEAAKQLNYFTNIKYGTSEKLKSDTAAKAKLKAAEEASAKAEEALKELEADPKQPKWKLQNAHNRLARAVNSLNSAKKAADAAASAVANLKKPSAEELAPAEEKLDTARKESAAARAERLNEPVGSKKRYLFQFSHVGILKNIDKLDNGKERWTTFDGGQLVDRDGQKVEGAQTSTRFYDPKSNEISGELQQGGEARWLYGWTDVDKLVADK